MEKEYYPTKCPSWVAGRGGGRVEMEGHHGRPRLRDPGVMRRQPALREPYQSLEDGGETVRLGGRQSPVVVPAHSAQSQVAVQVNPPSLLFMRSRPCRQGDSRRLRCLTRGKEGLRSRGVVGSPVGV